jgi:hypothetical protein
VPEKKEMMRSRDCRRENTGEQNKTLMRAGYSNVAFDKKKQKRQP